MQPDKQLIRQRFQRAAQSYDSQALTQQQTAEHLLDLLEEVGGSRFEQVLEIGCGTGLLTRRLLARCSGIRELSLNDLVPDFAARISLPAPGPSLVFLPGDIETLSLPASCDLIISASALHWIHDLDSLLARLSRHLKPGGMLAFSLYGPDNLQEIRSLSGKGLDYRSLAEVKALTARHVPVCRWAEERIRLAFASPQEVLRHLHRTGVNALERVPWTRAELRRFCAEYSRLFSDASGGVRLTWHPLYLIGQK